MTGVTMLKVQADKCLNVDSHTQIVPSRQSHEDTTGQSEKKALQCIASKCFYNSLIHELSDAKSQKFFFMKSDLTIY